MYRILNKQFFQILKQKQIMMSIIAVTTPIATPTYHIYIIYIFYVSHTNRIIFVPT